MSKDKEKTPEEIALKSVDEWMEHNASKINRRVKDFLDKRVIDTVAKIMGFNDDGFNNGKWRIDHCNGRSGNSHAGYFIKEEAKKVVDEWLATQFENPPNLPEAAIKDMKDEYLKIYRNHLHTHISERAEQRAKEDADEIVTRIVKDGFKGK